MDAKRLFDLAASSAGLAVLAPVLAGIGLAIKLNDKGPVFYRGERVGINGKPFRIFKFRTMVVDAEKSGVSTTSGADDRITPPGKLIRKFKLDELPQLINVALGDMSLVGPRPEVQKFVDLYTEEEKPILTVRPGITDYASIWNNDEGGVIAKSGIQDADEAYAKLIRPTKIKLQLRYVREHSLLTDIKLILRTLRAIVERNHDVSDIAPPPEVS
jgi:lipopolysaccharide/colanic/teichoic acid biosynthesis glycosyltransferase